MPDTMIDPRSQINFFTGRARKGEFGKDRATVFGSRNYPDFIIPELYLVAIEYAQSLNWSSI
jgi:hypothetical protein